MLHNPKLLFLMFIVCLFIFGFLVNLFYPAKPKRKVLSGIPHGTLLQQSGDIVDALDRADTLPKLALAEGLINAFGRNNKHLPGVRDDVDDWLKQVAAIRNKLLQKGMRAV